MLVLSNMVIACQSRANKDRWDLLRPPSLITKLKTALRSAILRPKIRPTPSLNLKPLLLSRQSIHSLLCLHPGSQVPQVAIVSFLHLPRFRVVSVLFLLHLQMDRNASLRLLRLDQGLPHELLILLRLVVVDRGCRSFLVLRADLAERILFLVLRLLLFILF